ncbi:MAG: hypothetical protein JNM89_13625 [Hyphomicrobiaceae bacterium]|nr:hypothetical protein [Hyphomicrobiaceae bacterium]
MSKTKNPARRAERLILVALTVSLPTLSLLPFGALYLWDKGWLVYWAIVLMLAVLTLSMIEHLYFKRAIQAEAVQCPAQSLAPYPDGSLSARAWGEVQAISAKADPGAFGSVQDAIDLGTRVTERVARVMHPDRSDPLWNFTLPEALLITERVSRRMGQVVSEKVPFADRLTFSQLRWAYRWRGAIGRVEQAYNLWRLLRIANPATAAANEVRERLSKAAFNWGREQFTAMLVRLYIEEVGRTAIDLYSGGLTDAPAMDDGKKSESCGP